MLGARVLDVQRAKASSWLAIPFSSPLDLANAVQDVVKVPMYPGTPVPR